jgi:hypothetical protein
LRRWGTNNRNTQAENIYYHQQEAPNWRTSNSIRWQVLQNLSHEISSIEISQDSPIGWELRFINQVDYDLKWTNICFLRILLQFPLKQKNYSCKAASNTDCTKLRSSSPKRNKTAGSFSLSKLCNTECNLSNIKKTSYWLLLTFQMHCCLRVSKYDFRLINTWVDQNLYKYNQSFTITIKCNYKSNLNKYNYIESNGLHVNRNFKT